MVNRLIRSRPVAITAFGLAAIALPLAFGWTQAGAAAPGPNTMVAVQPGFNVAAIPNTGVFGSTPSDTPETVSFVLKEQNQSQLEAQVENGVRNYLSVSQFASIYGQSEYNIYQLESYLANFDITTDAYADNIDVVANGTAGEFDSALAVQQYQYHVAAIPGRDGMAGKPAQTVHGAPQSPMLPYRIASFVESILGLDNYSPFVSQAVHTDTALTPPQAGSSSSCLALTGLPDACNLPANFASQYGLDSLYGHGAMGQGQTIGIVTLAALDPGAPQYFWSTVQGISHPGSVTVENIDGGPGAPSDAAGTGETDLDVEQSGGLAPDANLIVYQAPNTDYGFADAFFTAASQNVASTLSSSWGESETYLQYYIDLGEESPTYETAFDEAFLEMAEQGQSGFLAAGDFGAYNPARDLGTTNLGTLTSADSPYITAAGGTTLPWTGSLSGPDGTAAVSVPNQRTWGWDYLWSAISTVTGTPLATVAESDPVGGGGGFSTIEPTPSYQQYVPGTHYFSAVQYLTPTDYETIAPGLVEPTSWDFNPTPSVTHGYGSGRADPDVSTDADPYTGYLLYEPSFAGVGEPVLQGGWGGTSFVAPQLNGSTAVIDSYLGHRVGFWNPSIYSFATQRTSPFTPLTQSGTGSDNIYYTGTPGVLYNEGSGLGTPNLSQLAYDFRGF
jgi:kumamolisin